MSAAYSFAGRNQEGGLTVWVLNTHSILTCGPQKGGWKCLWNRKELCELYGYSTNLTTLQLVSHHARNWGLTLKRIAISP
jgi:hypothetical protein